MTKENINLQIKVRFWKTVMVIAAVFSFAICLLIIANYFQINRNDPVNTKVLNTLVERLNQTPDDQVLKEEIREFDLLARKAYFTTQWQIRFGGYLLLIGIFVIVISVLMLDSIRKKILPVNMPKEETLPGTQQQARKWIMIGGLTLTAVTLVFAFLSHKDIGNRFSQAGSQNPDSVKTTSAQNITAVASDTLVVADSSLVDSTLTAGTVIEYPTAAMKSNFPSFRGPGGNGVAFQKNIPTSWDGASGKNIRWKTEIPLPGYNSPVVWGDKVFLTGSDGAKQEIYCISKKTGEILWTAEVTSAEGSAPKSPKVTDDTGYSAPSVTTDGERVYAIFASGDVAAFDMKGSKVWARNLGMPSNHYGHSSSLLVIEGKLIVQYDQSKSANLYALSVTSGKTIWSTSRKVKISWASPVIVNTGSRVEILLLAEPFLASYDPSTGKELWKIDCTSGEVGPSVAYANGIVFALNEYAKLVAVKAGDKPTILWESNEYLSDVPSPVATDKYLIVVTSYGEVVCYNPLTGDKYWNHDFGTGTYSSPILLGEKVYLMDKKGVMHIFKADKTFTSLGDPKLGEETVCTPAFSDGKIFIRAGNNLYCVGK